MTLTTTIDIVAPPERVWAILMEFADHPRWNPFIRSIDGEAKEGERLAVSLGAPGTKPMTFRPVVTEVDAPRAFEWRGTFGAGWLFAGVHSFRLEPLAGGGTRLHHGEVFRGLLVGLMKRSLDTDTRRGFEAMNAALKAEAERS